VKTFVNAMHAHGFKPMIYTGTWFWNPKVGDDDFGLPLWIAGLPVTRAKVLPKPWKSTRCGSTRTRASVPGIHGNVDVNRDP
jgi:GH25 family lysozyme M1 (1,4-beta-N-acetylmuramidase)